MVHNTALRHLEEEASLCGCLCNAIYACRPLGLNSASGPGPSPLGNGLRLLSLKRRRLLAHTSAFLPAGPQERHRFRICVCVCAQCAFFFFFCFEFVSSFRHLFIHYYTQLLISHLGLQFQKV